MESLHHDRNVHVPLKNKQATIVRKELWFSLFAAARITNI